MRESGSLPWAAMSMIRPGVPTTTSMPCLRASRWVA